MILAKEIADYYNFLEALNAYNKNPSTQNGENLLLASSGFLPIPGIPSGRTLQKLFKQAEKIPGFNNYVKKLAASVVKFYNKIGSKITKAINDFKIKKKLTDNLKKDNPFEILHPNQNDGIVKNVYNPQGGANHEGYIMDIYNKGEVTVHRYGEYDPKYGQPSNIHIDLGQRHTEGKLGIEKIGADNSKLKDAYPLFEP